MDRRYIVIAAATAAVLALFISIFSVGARQNRNFAILLEQIRENSDQITQMDRLFERAGSDANEVRRALLMDPVKYSTTPSIDESFEEDRFSRFIEAFQALDSHYSRIENIRQLEGFINSPLFSEFLDKSALILDQDGNSFTLLYSFLPEGPVIFSGSVDSGLLGIHAFGGSDAYGGPADQKKAKLWIEKEFRRIESIRKRYTEFIQTSGIWLERSDVRIMLDRYKLAFTPSASEAFERVLVLKTSDNRTVAELKENDDGSFDFSGNTYPDFFAFAQRFPVLLAELDTRSFGAVKTDETVQAIRSTLDDPEFSSLLKAYSLTIAPETRSDDDFIYFDISRDGIHYAALGVLKEFGDLYLLDREDVHITRLDSLNVGRLLEGPDGLPDEKKKTSILNSNQDMSTILLCGTHEKNPDTMILFVGNKKTGKACLFSIPRDLYFKGQKINNIYRQYGPDQLLKDLGTITGLAIDSYISIDMYAFIDVINILGGVEITLKEPLIDPTYRVKEKGVWNTLHYNRGTHVLDGIGALRIARSRHTSSDFDRSARQQLIISALMEKMSTLAENEASTMYRLLHASLRHVSTNISPVEAVNLALAFRNVSIEGKYVLSGANTLYNTYSPSGLWILLPKDDNWDVIASFIKSKIKLN